MHRARMLVSTLPTIRRRFTILSEKSIMAVEVCGARRL